MRVSKVINNNMVAVAGDGGKETLLRGLGIGFGKKRGDEVDEAKVEQRYVLQDENLIRRFNDLPIDIDASIIDVCFDVVAAIKRECPREVSDSLYLLLTDHVYNLVERIQMGITFDNSVLWNLKAVYPEEYEVARHAVATLQSRLPYAIEDSEASFVTLHIVNAEMRGNMHETYQLTTYIEDIRHIVESNLGIEFDGDDYSVNRFLVHLRFLFSRLGTSGAEELDVDDDLASMIGERYPRARDVADKIATYIEASTGHKLSREEGLYLLVHLVQIFRSGLSSG